jgi:hypothetical protein
MIFQQQQYNNAKTVVEYDIQAEVEVEEEGE